jgi:hypothetical protein
MKKSNTIGNRTRDFPAVPKPTAPPRAPFVWSGLSKNIYSVRVTNLQVDAAGGYADYEVN